MKDNEFVNEIYRIVRLSRNPEMKEVVAVLEKYEQEFEYDYEKYED